MVGCPLALVPHGDVTPPLPCPLQVRESGILALGAIAEGCIDHIAGYLPQLVPWLVQVPLPPLTLPPITRPRLHTPPHLPPPLLLFASR